MTTTTAEVTVVVLNYCSLDDTTRCLLAVRELEHRSFRVHVIDNASPDGSGPRLQEWLATATGRAGEGDPAQRRSYGAWGAASDIAFTLSTRNDGYAAGNNIGLEHAARDGSTYAWVLNNDAVPAPGALRRMVAAHGGDPDVGAVGCTVLEDDGTTVQYLGGARYDRWTGRHRPAGAGLPASAGATASQPGGGRLDYVAGCSVLLPLEALRRTGALREGLFLFGEEIDLAQRLTAAGLRLTVARDAVVLHRGGRSSGASPDWRCKSPLAAHWASRSAVLVARLHWPRRAPVVAAVRLGLAAALLLVAPTTAGAVARGVLSGLRADLAQLRCPQLPTAAPEAAAALHHPEGTS